MTGEERSCQSLREVQGSEQNHQGNHNPVYHSFISSQCYNAPCALCGSSSPRVWRCIDCDFPILNKIQYLALFSRSLGKSSSWQKSNDGFRGRLRNSTALPWADSFFEGGTRSRVLGNFFHLPFFFSFPHLLFLSLFSQSSELYGYDPVSALCESSSSCFFFFFFLIPGVRRKGNTLHCESQSLCLFPPSTKQMPMAFQKLGSDSVRLLLVPGQHSVWRVVGPIVIVTHIVKNMELE